MKAKFNWLTKWIFLPFRLLYLLIYFIFCKILNVQNNKFKIYYHKKEKVIYSGWSEFYDANTYMKELFLSFLEPIIILLIITLYLIIGLPILGIISIYGVLYLFCKFDFISTLKYVKNYKKNQLIKKYLGSEIYYHSKWNYEDLTLKFPELIDIQEDTFEETLKNSNTINSCKKIWESQKNIKKDLVE